MATVATVVFESGQHIERGERGGGSHVAKVDRAGLKPGTSVSRIEASIHGLPAMTIVLCGTPLFVHLDM